MSFQPKELERKVVPRWRQLTRTQPDELRSALGRASPIDGSDEELEICITAWEQDKTLENAADLASAGFVLGKPEVAQRAAMQIVRNGNASPSIKMLSKRLLEGDVGFSGALKSLEEQHNNANQTIRYLRQRWSEFPRNPFLRVEAARAYLTRRQIPPAIDAMELALKLAPENRYVLRSAARLFVHVEDFKFAHDLLGKSESVKCDPWVLASEIAVSSLAGRTSRNIKLGKSLIAREIYSNIQTSELASALATVELCSGARKNSRKYFKQSLIDPNDNSLAQTAWANRMDPTLDFVITDQALKIPNSSEAKTIQCRINGDWKGLIDNCLVWLRDEPFSSRPAELGSYVAVALIGDFSLGEKFARAGLVSDPTNIALKNNLCVAVANQGNIQEAESVYNEIGEPETDREERVPYLATGGLIQFRKSNRIGGRELYLAAIDTAKRIGDMRLANLAILHYVNEELNIKSEISGNLLNDLGENIEKTKDKEIRSAFELVKSRVRPTFNYRKILIS